MDETGSEIDIFKSSAHIERGATPEQEAAYMSHFASKQHEVNILPAENENLTLPEIAGPDETSLSTRFAFEGADQETIDRISQDIIQVFEDYPKAGFILNTRDQGLVGILNLGKADDEEAQKNALFALNKIYTQATTNIGEGRFGIFISELPERQVCLTRLTPNNLVADYAQQAGATHAAWLEMDWRKNSEVGSVIELATPESINRLSEFGYKFSKIRDLAGAENTGVSRPTPKGRRRYFTQEVPIENIQNFVGDHNPQPDTSTTKSTYEETLHDLPSAVPGAEFLNKYIPDWQQQIKENGEIKAELSGGYAAIKVDLSGLSTMVAEGKDPSDYLSRVLARYVGPAHDIFGNNMLMSLEGDAVTILVPHDPSSDSAMFTNYLSLVSKGQKDFPANIRDTQEMGYMQDVAGHEIGMKAVIFMTKTPTEVTVYKGGFTKIHNQDSRDLGHEAELAAKTGGTDIVIVLDRELLSEEVDAIGDNPYLVQEQGKYRLVRIDSESDPVTVDFLRAVSVLGEPSQAEIVKTELARVQAALRSRSEEIKDIPNSILAIAEINLTLSTLELKNSNEILSKHLHPRTIEVLTQLLEGSEGLDPAFQSRYNHVVDVYNATQKNEHSVKIPT